MEPGDKIYIWLVVLTFLALGIGFGLQMVELGELQDPIPDASFKANPFDATVK